jgi:hypothetical protein
MKTLISVSPKDIEENKSKGNTEKSPIRVFLKDSEGYKEVRAQEVEFLDSLGNVVGRVIYDPKGNEVGEASAWVETNNPVKIVR